jgi:hypothetical protein
MSCFRNCVDVVDVGVVGGCSEICGILANKTGSGTIGTVCNILCDIVGVQEFANLLEKWVFYSFLAYSSAYFIGRNKTTY